MKTIFYLLAVMAFAMAVPSVPAAAGPAPEKESAVKQELKNHFSLYGFIRNYFTFDSRESASGTGNLFYYLPFERDLNEFGEDLNAQPSFRFLAITSRVGLDVNGYRIGKTDISAKVETDFYAGLSGSTGTATLRLRQAYMKLGWKDLPMCGGNTASVSLLMGQAWHPVAADQPDVISLATGAPFNAFNRSPQVTMDANLGKHFTLTGSLIYQMQYTSTGPEGNTANYMKYGILPEVYAGLAYKTGGFLVKGGVSLLSIKPRRLGTVSADGKDVQVRVSDRLTVLSPFIYMQYKYKTLTIKAKSIYAGAGDYLNLVGGYGITAVDEGDGHYEYAASRSSSSWLSVSFGKKLQGMLMAGYIVNLGTNEDILNTGNNYYYFFTKDGQNYGNMAQAYRIVPTIAYNVGKFTVGLEYEMTSAQFGDEPASMPAGRAGLVEPGPLKYWVTNHRIQIMTKFTF